MLYVANKPRLFGIQICWRKRVAVKMLAGEGEREAGMDF